VVFNFLIGIVGGGVQVGPLGTVATNRPIVPAPVDYDDGETGGMIGRGNRSTRKKPDVTFNINFVYYMLCCWLPKFLK
jgi:hypothetical protein